MPRTVLILGAGPGGLRAAEELRSLLPDEDRIVIVDRRDEQYLGVSLLGVMAGFHPPAEVTIHPSVLRERGVYFIQAEIESIDTENHRVNVSGTSAPLGYDALIVALGAELAPDQIDGLGTALESEHGGEYYTRDGAHRLHGLLNRFSGGKIAILVARLPYKCPPAPYEGALLIDDLLRTRGLREQVQIDIFTPEPAPIAPGGPPVSNAVRAILDDHDITLHTSATTQSVGPTSRTISFESGGSTSYDLLVGIPPHVPPAVVRQSKLGAHGWIEIDRDTMRTAIDAVWAIGDVSLLRLANGMPLPKAAVFATGEAEAAARDIASSFGYDAPSPMFDGHGRCWFVTASNEAGYVDGEFLHEPAPLVALHDSTRANFALLQHDEQDWLSHWKA